MSTIRNIAQVVWCTPRRLAIALLSLYQATLSPDHSPLRHLYPYGYCPHHPTCSQYGVQVLARDGMIRGCTKLALRLLSCHPWAEPDDKRLKRALGKV